MIHADAIVYASKKFLHQENDNQKAVGIQIAGNDPSIMTDAAKIISKYKPICNQINDDEQDTYNTTVRTTEPEPEPEPDSESDV